MSVSVCIVVFRSEMMTILNSMWVRFKKENVNILREGKGTLREIFLLRGFLFHRVSMTCWEMEEVSYAEVSNCILLLCFKGCAIYDVLYSAVTKMSRALKVKVKIYKTSEDLCIRARSVRAIYFFSVSRVYIMRSCID